MSEQLLASTPESVPPVDAEPDKEAAIVPEEKAPAPITADEEVPEEVSEPDEKPDEAEAKESEGPPEKYELGLDDNVVVPKELLDDAETVFRDLNLTNEQAKKIATLMPKAYEIQMEQWQGEQSKWAKESTEMFGDNLDPTIARAKSFINTFGGKDLMPILERTIGNHPSLLFTLSEAMKAMGEDSTPAKTSGNQKTHGDNLRKRYPTMFGSDD
jgi:hypothetical protein